MRSGKEALLLALVLATQAYPLQEAESTLEGAFTSYLGHVEALTAQLHLTHPDPLPESTLLLLVEQLSSSPGCGPSSPWTPGPGGLQQS